MNCLFCNQPTKILCQEDYVNDPGSIYEDYHIYIEYGCEPCHARFEFKDHSIECYSFTFDNWVARFDQQHKQFYLTEYLIKGAGWATYKDIIALDFLPDITPQNFEKKLPTILTFL